MLIAAAMRACATGKELRANRYVVLAAVQQTAAAVEYVADDLHSDADIRSARLFFLAHVFFWSVRVEIARLQTMAKGTAMTDPRQTILKALVYSH